MESAMSSDNPAVDQNDAPVFYLREEPHHAPGTLLGFWIYLMSDCLIFAMLFATRAVVAMKLTIPECVRPHHPMDRQYHHAIHRVSRNSRTVV